MYSNKANVNLLTAHLLAHGIRNVVVCPGSRNAPIVHNLHAVGSELRLHPITDERSAAFVAIGLWIKTKQPIAICVTSGSAILNCLPAIAEAAFRHIPLVIISADRPLSLLGKLDGQTLPQLNACEPYAKSWQIDEMTSPANAERVDELLATAFATLLQNGGQPIHLNVPISEPLFHFTTPELPPVASPKPKTEVTAQLPEHWRTLLREAQLPLVIIGQYEGEFLPAIAQLRAENKALVYAENISNQQDSRMAQWLDRTKLSPDAVIHLGGCLVNKFFKQHLRTLSHLPVLRIDESDECPDTFFQNAEKLKANASTMLAEIADVLTPKAEVAAAYAQLSDEVRPFSHSVEALFVGNSTAVRWANRQWPQVKVPVYCNRGTNGIEGSLSTAAGYSLVAEGKVLCIIGDLSFFYDANGLWNQHLDGRLRILLINNQCGAIFHHLPGLNQTPALPKFVAAAHHNSAKGLAESYQCAYLSATTTDLDATADEFIAQLLAVESTRPVILELFVPI